MTRGGRAIGRAAKIVRSTKTWLAIVAGAGVITATLIATNGRDKLDESTIRLELFKFSLTVVVGGVIAFVFRMAEAKRQIREVRQRELRDFYRRMLDAYNEAKKIRRLLRAHSSPVDSSQNAIQIPRKALDDLMLELQSAQLDFEALHHEAQASRKLFSDRDAVKKRLRDAEKYLREILKIHENMGSSPDPVIMRLGDEAWRELLCFFHDPEKLKERNVPEKDCLRFDREFSDRVDEIRTLIFDTSEEAATDV